MKHNGLQSDWIKEPRDLSICNLKKVAGEENKADGFTKLLGRNLFRVMEVELVPFVVA